MNLSYHEITRIEDPLLLPWLDAIQKNFPPDEQMLASFFLNILHRKKSGDAKINNTKMIAVQDDTGSFIGDLMYELSPDKNVCYLWYIVVDSSNRTQGIGTQMYQWMVAQAQKSIPDLNAIVFEIERPDQAADEQERIASEKRIRFYKKQGAKIAVNVVYVQSVGDWQPAKRMYLCLHPVRAITDADALALLKSEFGEAMEAVDHLVLE